MNWFTGNNFCILHTETSYKIPKIKIKIKSQFNNSYCRRRIARIAPLIQVNTPTKPFRLWWLRIEFSTKNMTFCSNQNAIDVKVKLLWRRLEGSGNGAATENIHIRKTEIHTLVFNCCFQKSILSGTWFGNSKLSVKKVVIATCQIVFRK